jgi:hypothetical protein
LPAVASIFPVAVVKLAPVIAPVAVTAPTTSRATVGVSLLIPILLSVVLTVKILVAAALLILKKLTALEVGVKLVVPLHVNAPLFTIEPTVNAPVFSCAELLTLIGADTLEVGGFPTGAVQALITYPVINSPTINHPDIANKKYLFDFCIF